MKLSALISSIQLVIASSRGWSADIFASLFDCGKVLIILQDPDLRVIVLLIMEFYAGSLLSNKVQKDRSRPESPEPETSTPAPPPPFYPIFDTNTGHPAPPDAMDMVDAIEHTELPPPSGPSGHQKGSFALPSPSDSATSSSSGKPARNKYRKTTPEEQHTIMVLAKVGKRPCDIALSLGLKPGTVAKWLRVQRRKGLATHGLSAAAGVDPLTPSASPRKKKAARNGNE
ncbi:hypothetical protein NDA16_001426 [Ustilago loliicola]|nr:hypothetical protein NDA16_001426 [Ustilago loliicola]